ncbi:hypothetical protein V8F06_007333 [Rhypophila decipiens]
MIHHRGQGTRAPNKRLISNKKLTFQCEVASGKSSPHISRPAVPKARMRSTRERRTETATRRKRCQPPSRDCDRMPNKKWNSDRTWTRTLTQRPTHTCSCIIGVEQPTWTICNRTALVPSYHLTVAKQLNPSPCEGLPGGRLQQLILETTLVKYGLILRRRLKTAQYMDGVQVRISSGNDGDLQEGLASPLLSYVGKVYGLGSLDPQPLNMGRLVKEGGPLDEGVTVGRDRIWRKGMWEKRSRARVGVMSEPHFP